jgi:biopolymer transport protein ExbB
MRKQTVRTLAMAAVAVFAGLLCAWAQEPAAKSAIKETMTFAEIFKAGGWLMYPISAMSLIGVALIVYYLIVLRAEQVAPRKWLREVRDLLLQRRLDDARALCDSKPSPAAAIVAVAIDHAKSSGGTEPGLLKDIIESEGTRQATRIQNQIAYLQDIAVITPMMGLLGTVLGMLQAFNAVALDLAKAKPMLLAAGVSLALITTIAGLIVAIPAMIGYAYFRNRASNLIARLESVSADLLTLLIG